MRAVAEGARDEYPGRPWRLGMGMATGIEMGIGIGIGIGIGDRG